MIAIAKRSKRKLPTIGFTVYSGASALGGGDVIGIVTIRSANPKTGDMSQLWIMPLDRSPLEALQSNDNHASCGDCPL